MTAVLSALGWRGAAFLAMAALALWYRDQAEALDSALARETARADRLAGEVRRGNAAFATCESANASQLETLRQCHAYTGDLARETRELEAALHSARASATAQRERRDAQDTELAARPADERPTVAEANAILHERGQGWLWR